LVLCEPQNEKKEIPMPLPIDRIDFACANVDPTEWPKLSCGGANQLRLEAGSLRLEAGREVLFEDNGQIRSLDDNHRLVFNRAGNQVELHALGALRFLTGAPAPTEKLRIDADGNVGIGTDTPSARLHVAGELRTDGSLRVTGDAQVQGNLNLSGTANLGGDVEAQGNLHVSGIVDAADIHRNGTPLRVSQWEDVAGGIGYIEGNVGIGTLEPQRPLQIGGAVAGISFAPADASPNAGYIRFGDNTGWKLHIGRSQEGVGEALNTGITGVLMTIQDNGNIGIGTVSPEGSLDVRGDIRAGNSALYFTLTNHGHSGIGNQAGYAAIENAQDYDALMILGRAGTAHGRKVRLWDYLEVVGTFVNNSDERSKTDIEDLHYGLAEILKLRPVAFNWKNIPNIHKSLGFIAQEVKSYIQEVV
jgi:hypothetical protein